MLVRAWTSPDYRSTSPQAGSHTGARGRALGQDSEAPRLPLGPSYGREPQESLWGAGGSGRKKQILRSDRLCTCRHPRLLGEKGARTYILLLCCYHHTRASSLNLGRKCAEKKGVNRWRKTAVFYRMWLHRVPLILHINYIFNTFIRDLTWEKTSKLSGLR